MDRNALQHMRQLARADSEKQLLSGMSWHGNLDLYRWWYEFQASGAFILDYSYMTFTHTIFLNFGREDLLKFSTKFQNLVRKYSHL